MFTIFSKPLVDGILSITNKKVNRLSHKLVLNHDGTGNWEQIFTVNVEIATVDYYLNVVVGVW